MNGISATDGKLLSGIDHLFQSVRDILTTPLGSRVMRRTYGCNIFYMIDQPINRSSIAAMRAEAANALASQEPRISVTKISVTRAAPGEVEFSIEGKYLPDGQPVKLDGIVIK